jgi:hypothetical protein
MYISIYISFIGARTLVSDALIVLLRYDNKIQV